MSIDISSLIMQQQDASHNKKPPSNKHKSDFADWLAERDTKPQTNNSHQEGKTANQVADEPSVELLQMMQKLNALMQQNKGNTATRSNNEVLMPEQAPVQLDATSEVTTQLPSLANLLATQAAHSDPIAKADSQQLLTLQMGPNQGLNVTNVALNNQQNAELIEHFLMQSWATGQMANSYVSSASQPTQATTLTASSAKAAKASGNGAPHNQLNHFGVHRQHALSQALNVLVQGQQFSQKSAMTESPSKVSLVAMSLPTPNKLKDKNITQTRDEQGLKVWLRDFNHTQSELTQWLIEMSQSNQHISQVAYNGHVIWQR